MGQDEYILGLLAIISGLAITHMVAGLHFLLSRMKSIRFDWSHGFAAILIAYAILNGWWGSWYSYQGIIHRVAFYDFLIGVTQSILIFLAARAVMPAEQELIDASPEDRFDLAEHYERQRIYIWACVLLAGLLSFAVVALDMATSVRVTRGYLDVFIQNLPIVILLLFKNRWVHRILLPTAFIFLVAQTILRTL